MSYESSDFAKRLLASGRADIDPEHLALKRSLLARLEAASSSAEAGPLAASGSKRAFLRWSIGGLAVGMSVLALLATRQEYSSSPNEPSGRSEASAQSGSGIAMTDAVRETSPSTPTTEILVPVTPDALPSVAPSTNRASTNRVPTLVLPSAASPTNHAPAPVLPSDLLREANQLRAQARWADAAKKYEQVLRHRVDSPEAYPATVALAKLDVDHLEDPRRALALYDRAMMIAPEGSLADEAAWGRTRALRALGRHDDERSALRSFLSRYPSSLLAGLAAERLKNLEAL
jgi:tetratricopeptide (TPR) repeat protein